MKILVFTSLFPNHLNPDNAVFIKNRMFNFAQRNDCEIRVVAPVPYCPPIKALDKWYPFSQIQHRETMEGIAVYHPRFPLIPKISMQVHGLLMFLWTIGLVRKIKREFDFDLIDAHYIYPDGLAGVLMGQLFNRPVVVSARGSDINQFSHFKTIKPLIRWTLKKSDHIISVCKALKDVMADFGAEKKNISVIPNGIDIHRFGLESKGLSKKKLQLDTSEKIIFSVGGLITRKGHHIVIEAMETILKKIPGARFFIAGEGEYRHALEKKITATNLNDKVTLLGHIPNSELKKWYNAADVFCLASSREGWANVIMESMACGTPVVATNVWGAPEVITSSKVGILVDRNPESIAKGLVKALTADWNRELIRTHVAKRTWGVVAREVQDVFCSVLDQGSSDRGAGD